MKRTRTPPKYSVPSFDYVLESMDVIVKILLNAYEHDFCELPVNGCDLEKLFMMTFALFPETEQHMNIFLNNLLPSVSEIPLFILTSLKTDVLTRAKRIRSLAMGDSRDTWEGSDFLTHFLCLKEIFIYGCVIPASYVEAISRMKFLKKIMFQKCRDFHFSMEQTKRMGQSLKQLRVMECGDYSFSGMKQLINLRVLLLDMSYMDLSDRPPNLKMETYTIKYGTPRPNLENETYGVTSGVVIPRILTHVRTRSYRKSTKK